MIRVDSPGGSGLASDIIWHAVDAAKAKKPVVISMGDVAASGWLLHRRRREQDCRAAIDHHRLDRRVCRQACDEGFLRLAGYFKRIRAARQKCGHVSRDGEVFAEERAKFEEWIKTTYYDDFVPKVAKGRNKDAAYIDSVGQGRVWTGAQGKERGLGR